MYVLLKQIYLTSNLHAIYVIDSTYHTALVFGKDVCFSVFAFVCRCLCLLSIFT